MDALSLRVHNGRSNLKAENQDCRDSTELVKVSRLRLLRNDVSEIIGRARAFGMVVIAQKNSRQIAGCFCLVTKDF
jgi:hypothetical protein